MLLPFTCIVICSIWGFSLVSQVWVLHPAPFEKELFHSDTSLVCSLDLYIVLMNIQVLDSFRLQNIWRQFAEQLQINPLLDLQQRPDPKNFIVQRIMNAPASSKKLNGKGSWTREARSWRWFYPFVLRRPGGQMLWFERTSIVTLIKTSSADMCKQMAGRQRETAYYPEKKPTEKLFFHQCQWMSSCGRCSCMDRGTQWKGTQITGGCNEEVSLNIQPHWWHLHPSHLLWF